MLTPINERLTYSGVLVCYTILSKKKLILKERKQRKKECSFAEQFVCQFVLLRLKVSTLASKYCVKNILRKDLYYDVIENSNRFVSYS